MKIKPFAFSFLVAFIIALSFLFIIFWIFFKYAGDVVAAQAALGATGSFFGGMATLGAAVVAGYLFNDWRDEHKAKFISQICEGVARDIKGIMSDNTRLKKICSSARVIQAGSNQNIRNINFIPQPERELIKKEINLIDGAIDNLRGKIDSLEFEINYLSVICQDNNQELIKIYNNLKLQVEPSLEKARSIVEKNSYMLKLKYASDAQTETLKYLTSFQRKLAETIRGLNIHSKDTALT